MNMEKKFIICIAQFWKLTKPSSSSDLWAVELGVCGWKTNFESIYVTMYVYHFLK